MNIPITDPQLNLSATDASTTDDSIKQEGVTINASNGSVVNTNSGNGQSKEKLKSALLLTLCVSVICDILVCGLIMWNAMKSEERMYKSHIELRDSITKIDKGNIQLRTSVDAIDRKNIELDGNIERIDRMLGEISKHNKEEMKRVKEGNIWLIRNDLLKSMDIYEAKGEITDNVFHALQDEYKHYREIGGNYDVEDRWDAFRFKVQSNAVKLKKVK